jgi:hypothetical protein
MAVIPRPMDRDQVGITREAIPPGAERLFAALVRRGLRRENWIAAAQLCAELERRPPE